VTGSLTRAAEQQRSEIRSVHLESVKTGNICGRMAIQYNEKRMRQTEVHEQVETFEGELMGLAETGDLPGRQI
jgi:hypothetical protein